MTSSYARRSTKDSMSSTCAPCATMHAITRIRSSRPRRVVERLPLPSDRHSGSLPAPRNPLESGRTASCVSPSYAVAAGILIAPGTDMSRKGEQEDDRKRRDERGYTPDGGGGHASGGGKRGHA